MIRPRDIARDVCTPQQFRAWDLVETHGFTLRRAAELMNIEHTTVRDHVVRARQKLAERSRADFFAPERIGGGDPLATQNSRAAMVIGLLAERDGPACYLCGRVFPPIEMRVDHVVPRLHGGGDEPWNLGLACVGCNSKRGTQFVSLLLSSRLAVYHSDAGCVSGDAPHPPRSRDSHLRKRSSDRSRLAARKLS